MSQLRHKMSEIRGAGAEFIVVGNGTPAHAAWFVEDQKVDFPVFTDPSRAVYRELGFERSVFGLLSFGALKNALRAHSGGSRQASLMAKGDAMQLGGVVVVRKGGEIVWRYASKDAGDHPDPEDIIAALKSALAA